MEYNGCNNFFYVFKKKKKLAHEIYFSWKLMKREKSERFLFIFNYYEWKKWDEMDNEWYFKLLHLMFLHVWPWHKWNFKKMLKQLWQTKHKLGGNIPTMFTYKVFSVGYWTIIKNRQLRYYQYSLTYLSYTYIIYLPFLYQLIIHKVFDSQIKLCTHPLDWPLFLFSKNLILTRSVTPHSCNASVNSWSVVHY